VNRDLQEALIIKQLERRLGETDASGRLPAGWTAALSSTHREPLPALMVEAFMFRRCFSTTLLFVFACGALPRRCGASLIGRSTRPGAGVLESVGELARISEPEQLRSHRETKWLLRYRIPLFFVYRGSSSKTVTIVFDYAGSAY